MKPTKFSRGAKVKVNGLPGTHVVSYVMLIPIPSVVNKQFVLVDRELLKFINDKEIYYTWAEDATK